MSVYRLMILVDLPSATRYERKSAREFGSWLFSNGYSELQTGVYTRVVSSQTHAETHAQRVRAQAPIAGTVRLLVLTEQQFETCELVSGVQASQEMEIGSQLDIFL